MVLGGLIQKYAFPNSRAISGQKFKLHRSLLKYVSTLKRNRFEILICSNVIYGFYNTKNISRQ